MLDATNSQRSSPAEQTYAASGAFARIPPAGLPAGPTDEGALERPRPVALALAWQELGREPARLSLVTGLISLGSHPDNSVALSCRLVSRYHCRLHVRDDGSVWLRDLSSKNGTFVDGARIVEVELGPGSRIKLGNQEMRLERTGVELALEALPGMVARDPIMGPAVSLLRKAAGARLPVILRGETGTGKEVAARALHALSPRASGPFVALNCGAISAELAEAELFGHERGAFTGAVASSPGAFGAADGGTLFLDEIGELPLSQQVKLLRALESDEVKPVGAAKSRRVDVRILCATHRDLRARVRSGEFREDLFYRLQGVEVVLPPLRSRPRDILAIADKLLAREGEGARLAPDARAALLGHSWPGNARELIHSLRLALLIREGKHLHASDLRLESPLYPAEGERSQRCSEEVAAEGYAMANPAARLARAPQTLSEMEEQAVRSAYQRHRGHRRAMAAELGIARSSLLRKLGALGLRG